MTQSKLERLRKELIAKHGDRTLIIVQDRHTGATIFTHSISTVGITCTADLREVERIIASGKPPHHPRQYLMSWTASSQTNG